MNERINELKSQCIFRETRGTTAFNSYVVDRFDTEKFAELIVRECVDIVSGTAVNTPPNDLFYGYNLGVNKAAENIKERFGIEELSPFNTVNS